MPSRDCDNDVAGSRAFHIYVGYIGNHAFDRLPRDRTLTMNAVVEVRRDSESFKFVSQIRLLYTNVRSDPIALHAARVYLRCCDARPDARIRFFRTSTLPV